MLKLLGDEKVDVRKIAQIVGMEPRQVHYVLSEILNDYVSDSLGIETKRGQRTMYPRAVLNRILFINMVQDRLSASDLTVGLSRDEWRNWMNDLSDEEVEKVVRKEEPLVLGIERIGESGVYVETTDGERIEDGSVKYGRTVSGVDKRAHATPEGLQAGNCVFKAGLLVEVHVRAQLSDSQKAQLQLVTDLAKQIVDGGATDESTD